MTIILQPPPLSSDAKYPPCARQLGERRVVWNLLHQLAGIGYKIVAVDDGEGREDLRKVADPFAAAFDAIFAGDESNLIVRHPDDAKNMVIFFVLGNAPDEVVNDHSDVPGDAGFTAFMSAFDYEAYA